ncbi:MAG: hypothetical protein L3J84_04070 [Gammaproteobacteria bacterium]|nr:hypothetical protein [Gammaproteobacteria bacterium]
MNLLELIQSTHETFPTLWVKNTAHCHLLIPQDLSQPYKNRYKEIVQKEEPGFNIPNNSSSRKE